MKLFINKTTVSIIYGINYTKSMKPEFEVRCQIQYDNITKKTKPYQTYSTPVNKIYDIWKDLSTVQQDTCQISLKAMINTTGFIVQEWSLTGKEFREKYL